MFNFCLQPNTPSHASTTTLLAIDNSYDRETFEIIFDHLTRKQNLIKNN
jgi:hypothetical protein